jgi:hypothetical protein
MGLKKPKDPNIMNKTVNSHNEVKTTWNIMKSETEEKS